MSVGSIGIVTWAGFPSTYDQGSFHRKFYASYHILKMYCGESGTCHSTRGEVRE